MTKPDSRSEVLRYFETPAKYLRRDYGVRVRADIVADLTDGLPPGEALDAGCGDGRVSAPLVARGHRVTFLDPSRPMLELARGCVPEGARAEFVEGTLEDLPPGRRYPLVLCMGLLAHVGSVETVLSRLAALTSPGGVVLIQITDCGSWIGRLNYAYLRWRERFTASRGYLLNRLDVDILTRLARPEGFSVEAVTRYSLVLPGMMRLPDGFLYAFSAWSRRPPMKRIGGEVILTLRRAGGQQGKAS